MSGSDVPGVARNRGAMVVRLRRTIGTPPEGIYQCIINQQNMMDVMIVNVGLYNSGRGIQLKLNNGAIQFLPHRSCHTFQWREVHSEL